MKIVFSLESFFPTHRAGTEVYVLNLCRYFIAKGWEVKVLISTTEEQEDYTYEDIPVHTFPVPSKATTQELNGITVPRGIEEFTEVLNAIQPDWVHFHTFGRAINSYHLQRAKDLGFKTAFTPHLGGTFCIKGNLRLFEETNCDGKVDENRCTACFIHSKGKNKPMAKVLGAGIGILTKQQALKKALPPAWYQAHHRKQELKRMAQFADVIFAIAPWMQQAFIANGIHKAILIPQGISPSFFEQEKTSHKPIQKPIQFVFVGRMHSSKGFHLLQQAWDQLELQDDIHLHIITNPSGGELTYFNTHKTWAAQQHNVTWNEGLNQEKVANYFNEMDVLLLPSISNEVAPLVILEAATRKIPTLASDYIAMKDSIQHNIDGWLFENGNIEDFKEKLNALIAKPDQILNISKNIKQPHSMDEVAALVEEYLMVD